EGGWGGGGRGRARVGGGRGGRPPGHAPRGLAAELQPQWRGAMHEEPKSGLDRRSFLRAVGGSVAVVASAGSLLGAKTDLLIIDCHAHLYSEDTTKSPPGLKTPLTPPRGTGTVAHLRRLMKENGVRFVNCTQPRSYYHYDNRFTADTARAHRDWMIGVVNLDPDDPRSPAILERYVRDNN